MTAESRFRFAVNRGGVMLLAVASVDAVGTGLYLAGSALFFTKFVGLSVEQVGIGLSVAGFLGFFSPIPFGRFADRWSPRTVLVLLKICCAAGFASYVLVDDFPSFLVVAGVLGIAEQAARPLQQALVEQVVGEAHRSVMSARMRVAYNAGYTVGGLLAALAIQIGAKPAFLALMLGDALSFVLCAVLLAVVKLRVPARSGASARARRSLPALRDLRYVAVTGVNAVLLLHMSLLSVGIPLWVTLHTRAPQSLVAILLVVNTVLTILFQVRLTRGSEDVRGGVTALRRASAALAVSCVFFAVSGYVPSSAVAVALLVAGMTVMTTGELFQSAGGWSLSFSLAPVRSRVEYFATFHLGSSAQVAFGPLLMTIGVIGNGTTGWAALAALFLGAGLLVAPVAAAAARRPELAAGPEAELAGGAPS
jgi:MFS family permease